MMITGSLSQSHQRTKRFFIALVFLCSLTPHTAHAVEWSTIPKIIIAAATGYTASQVYVAYRLQSISDQYASMRYILSTHEHDQAQCLQALKREILRKHDHMMRAQWCGTSPYATLPLLWYASKLDCTIKSLTLLSWFNADCGRGTLLAGLLEDLHTIRDYIITDYDYIREQRLNLRKQ